MNDYEVKKMLENEQIPEELEPERIKAMLDEKAPAVKRKNITAVSRFAAIAAACAVVSGTAVYVAGNGTKPGKSTQEAVLIESDTVPSTVSQNGADSSEIRDQAPYMSGAEDYSQIYELMRESYNEYQHSGRRNSGVYFADGALYGTNGNVAETDEESLKGIDDTEGGKASGHSDTFNQEEGVLEADIVKTDGNYIYTLKRYDLNTSNPGRISIVPVNGGKFGKITTIDPYNSLKDIVPRGHNHSIELHEMYLYNDMLIVIGSLRTYTDVNAEEYYTRIYGNYDVNSKNRTFITAYSTDESHSLIGTYFQDGRFNNVRIAPDGYLYLISDYASQSYSKINSEKNIECYIPSAGMAESYDFLAPSDILMPDSALTPSDSTCCSVIGSLDLNTPGNIAPVEKKALAGYSGEIYCSAENLYTAVYDFYDDLPEDVEYGFTVTKTSETEITRISIGGGKITPAASGKIAGEVNDQFSMSEYNGYFRVAATCDEYTMTYTKGVYSEGYVFDEESGSYTELEEPEAEEYGYYDYSSRKQDNRLYVLDLNLDIVGTIGDFGIDESVKSVNFNGDMAYVVTYEQTDPLFAIDLSKPDSPKILDEYKMLGYSSYMQKWSDGLLIGFGPDADENGRETGIKMVMFDNSDPNELKEAGKVTLNSTENSSLWSDAVYDRKALLIDPEKNLIAFPAVEYYYGSDYIRNTASYKFYSYENGSFVHKGDISVSGEKEMNNLVRALYIGDQVYVVSENNDIISADIDGMKVIDRISIN